MKAHQSMKSAASAAWMSDECTVLTPARCTGKYLCARRVISTSSRFVAMRRQSWVILGSTSWLSVETIQRMST